MDNKKYGWTEKGILGFIFTPLGALFVIIGVVMLKVGAVDPEERIAFLISFVGVGAAFFLVGAVLLLIDLRRRRRLRAAFEGGYCVTGVVAGYKANTRVNMMGSHPIMVEAHYTDPDTGVVHVYYSRYLYVNVSDLLTSGEVPIYIDRNDNRVGFVDIDAILPTIEVHR